MCTMNLRIEGDTNTSIIKVDQPDPKTMAAMLEAERIAKDPSVKGYTDLDELFTDLKK